MFVLANDMMKVFSIELAFLLLQKTTMESLIDGRSPCPCRHLYFLYCFFIWRNSSQGRYDWVSYESKGLLWWTKNESNLWVDSLDMREHCLAQYLNSKPKSKIKLLNRLSLLNTTEIESHSMLFWKFSNRRRKSGQ